jgi:hypothetical protein
MQKGSILAYLGYVCVGNKYLPAMHVSLHQSGSRKERASTYHQALRFPWSE